MFAELFPASFWSLALAHGLALLSPGPDFMLVLSHGARHRLSGTLFICLGIALGNAVYIILAIAGWAGIREHAGVYRLLELAGAAYLGWLGWRLLGSRPRDENVAADVSGADRRSACAQLFLGLASALLNPKNMVFYLTLMTVLVEAEAALSQRIAAGVWMCTAVFLWDVFVAAVVSHAGVQKVVWRRVHLVERVCGVFFLFLAVSLFVAPWV